MFDESKGVLIKLDLDIKSIILSPGFACLDGLYKGKLLALKSAAEIVIKEIEYIESRLKFLRLHNLPWDSKHFKDHNQVSAYVRGLSDEFTKMHEHPLADGATVEQEAEKPFKTKPVKQKFAEPL